MNICMIISTYMYRVLEIGPPILLLDIYSKFGLPNYSLKY